MTTVVAVGEAMIELSAAGDHVLEWTFAGDTLNCAAAIAASSGAHVRYLTGIGDDPASAEFVDFCRTLGVDASDSPIVAGRNMGVYWISTHDGERRFRYWRNESAARQLLSGGVVVPELDERDVLVLSGITMAVAGSGGLALLEQARDASERGIHIVYDVNFRDALWPDMASARAAAEAIAPFTRILSASADDVEALWGDDARSFIDRMTTAGAGEILVTDGPRPVVARVDGVELEVQPPPVDVVDTTAAGDAFLGTYVGGRLGGDEPLRAIERAVEVSSIVIRSRGAFGR